ncbi:glucoside xylosyltransferase 2 [Drosophila navojoa]|uniref:glucoside xylosyltransferase 2 n=1 Tax=Drosophila navojoa TaxID=7232 RepID=UPI0011BE6C48|nr:glucoside xylosyltransferase 2 [Drosophila navojoa]
MYLCSNIRNKMRNFHMCFLSCVALTTILYIFHERPNWDHAASTQPDTDNNEMRHKKNTFHIVAVACGQRAQETLVMIKSALLYNYYQEYIKFIIFTEAPLADIISEKLTDWRETLSQQFDFELLSLKFPNQSEKEWKNLFKPCAAQRLFLPSLLKDVDSLLYVDTDILFLSPITDIWKYFGKFNETQIAALAPEHENENIGWYNRFARHPFYGPLGVNSGVMLMNLTRMRQFNWEQHVFPIYKEFKLRITWGDQDIINILFYYHPDKLYIIPCEYNYRPDHCMYMSICNSSHSGIKLIHGNRGYFHSDKQPLFKTIYAAIESYQLSSNLYNDFLLPLRAALNAQSVNESSCGKVSGDILLVANSLFSSSY